VPDSLRNEFRDRGRDDGSDYGKGIATTNAVLGLISTFISIGSHAFPPEVQGMSGCINGPIGILSLVLFIMFWVKIANYSAQLSAPDDFSQRELERKLDKFDEGDDDYGRGAPRTDEPPKDDPTRPSPDTYKEGDPGRYQ
jgi:hypothetical protein